MAEPKRVFIHIGAPKTGTTYLQKVLAQNRDEMEAAGVLYPRVGPRGAPQRGLVGAQDASRTPTRVQRSPTTGTRLVQESLDWTGDTVVISSELFCFSRRRKIAEIVSAFVGVEVHIIYTARDLMRQVPAVWQEQVKNREVMGYQDFLVDVLGGRRSPLATMFWNGQDAPRCFNAGRAARRRPCAPRHRATPGGADRPAVGAVRRRHRPRSRPVPVRSPRRQHVAQHHRRRDVCAGTTNGMRRDLPILDYRRLVRRRLDPAFAATSTDGSRLPLSPAQRNTIVDLSERWSPRCGRAGYDVVGSLDELLPARPGRDDPAPGRGPTT